MSLYDLNEFRSHSGKLLNWKVDCDALTSKDWECLAFIISENVKFNKVIGIPIGGIPLA